MKIDDVVKGQSVAFPADHAFIRDQQRCTEVHVSKMGVALYGSPAIITAWDRATELIVVVDKYDNEWIVNRDRLVLEERRKRDRRTRK